MCSLKYFLFVLSKCLVPNHFLLKPLKLQEMVRLKYEEQCCLHLVENVFQLVLLQGKKTV